jgi:hypothetical protein
MQGSPDGSTTKVRVQPESPFRCWSAEQGKICQLLLQGGKGLLLWLFPLKGLFLDRQCGQRLCNPREVRYKPTVVSY